MPDGLSRGGAELLESLEKRRRARTDAVQQEQAMGREKTSKQQAINKPEQDPMELCAPRAARSERRAREMQRCGACASNERARLKVVHLIARDRDERVAVEDFERPVLPAHGLGSDQPPQGLVGV